MKRARRLGKISVPPPITLEQRYEKLINYVLNIRPGRCSTREFKIPAHVHPTVLLASKANRRADGRWTFRRQ